MHQDCQTAGYRIRTSCCCIILYAAVCVQMIRHHRVSGRRLGGLARQRGLVARCNLRVYHSRSNARHPRRIPHTYTATKPSRNTPQSTTTMSNPPGLPGVERRYAQVNGLKYRKCHPPTCVLYPRLSHRQPRQTTSLARRVNLTRTPSSSFMASLTCLMVGER